MAPRFAPPRFRLRTLLPFAAVLTALFGLYYVGWGVVALRRGNASFALFYGVYGLGGLVLGVALWRVCRQWRRAAA